MRSKAAHQKRGEFDTGTKPGTSTLTKIWAQSLCFGGSVIYGVRLGIAGKIMAKLRTDGIFPKLDISVCHVDLKTRNS